MNSYSARKGFIGNLELKNRFIMAPMATRYAAPNGEVTERMLAYYAERAKGGVGLIIVETSHIEVAGRNMTGGLGIYSDSNIPGLKSLVDRIHQNGAKAAIQLLHRGRSAFEHVTGQPVKLVSFVPRLCPPGGRVLSIEEIEELIVKYGEAALRAKKAGFDAVEIHGAHGYIINQFMSPLTNRRTDEYGGSLENRMRFPLRVIESVRKYVGDDFPVIFRMGVLEGYPGGMVLEDTLPMAKMLAESAIDALHVSAGITESNCVIPRAEVPKAWNAENTMRVRQVVGSMPIIAVGRYSDPDLAEAVLRDGTADFVALGRPLIADPYYVEKYFQGRQEEIIRCIACNEGCIGRTSQGMEVRCALNPATSLEYQECPVSEPAEKKNIWVVGGGPAGMEAALQAAKLGHKVTLMERTADLGGLLHIASQPPYKENLLEIITSYKARLNSAGVKVLTNTTVTSSDISNADVDMVFVAAGSQPIRPRFCENAPGIVTADKILSGEVSLENDVIILGGGMIGCELAEYAATLGKRATIIEMRGELAPDLLPGPRNALLKRLEALEVRVLTNAEIQSVGQDGSIQYKSRFGVLKTLAEKAQIVLAVGYRPDTSLCRELDSLDIPFVEVGDCRRTAKIMDAVHDAYSAVRKHLGPSF